MCRRLAAVLFLLSSSAALSAADYNLRDYGPLGSDIKVNTATIQRAIDACAAAGGGRVIVPAGPAIPIATIVLQSHVELHLENGSRLVGSPHYADFTRFAPWPLAFPPEPVTMSGVIVYAEDATDVAITGSGMIDGNSPAYVTKHDQEIDVCPNERPFTVVLVRCRRTTLRDFTLKDSPFWTLRLLGCDGALIDGLRIDGDRLMPNNDGIDLDWSSNIRIQGCDIRTGDDCISLKTTPTYTGPRHPCENITVTNCTLRTRSAALAIGCDVQGLISDAVFSNCVIKDSHRGIAVRLSCNGSIERMLFSNITVETRRDDPRWWGAGEPIQILALPWNKDYHNGVIRDLRFSNIVCRGENGVVIVSNEPGHVSNIQFDQVSLTIDKTTKFDGSKQDFRPNETDPMPAIPVSGYLLRYASDVVWRDCPVTWGPHRPAYYQHVLDAQNCSGLETAGLTGPAAHPGVEAMLVRDPR